MLALRLVPDLVLLAFLALAALAGGGGGGAGEAWFEQPDSRRRVPGDPEEALSLDGFRVESGTAAWMPPAWADRPRLRASSTRAWIEPPGLAAPVPLDLDSLELVGLEPVHGRSVAHEDAQCRGRLVGPGTDVVVRGPWIAFAWLGRLAGWPDPATTPDPV